MKTWIAILLTVGLIIGCGWLVVVTDISLFVPMAAGEFVPESTAPPAAVATANAIRQKGD